jgi:3-oxoacyl-[acyl-carrier-protein] synthase-3
VAKSRFENIKLAGIAAAVPKNEFLNKNYDWISEKDRNLLIKTTGVKKKRQAPLGMTSSDLCLASAEQLISDLSWDKDSIDALIFLSQSPDYYLPATSVILQHKLGLKNTTMAFDIGLGCSGYVYGLQIASSLINGEGIKRVLLLVGDVSTATCAYTDKSTFPLFGDAGTATALEYAPKSDSFSFELFSDGEGYESIIIEDGGVRNLIDDSSLKINKLEEGIERSKLHLSLKGLDVFNFSVGPVPKTIKSFLLERDLKPEIIDFFIMHQANKLMNESIRKKLKFSEQQTPYSLQDYGNTSSASIPLTMVTELGKKMNGEKSILMAGFGVGLSWGIAVIRANDVQCSKLIEI